VVICGGWGKVCETWGVDGVKVGYVGQTKVMGERGVR
jgi:hypothetical protein